MGPIISYMNVSFGNDPKKGYIYNRGKIKVKTAPMAISDFIELDEYSCFSVNLIKAVIKVVN